METGKPLRCPLAPIEPGLNQPVAAETGTQCTTSGTPSPPYACTNHSDKNSTIGQKSTQDYFNIRHVHVDAPPFILDGRDCACALFRLPCGTGGHITRIGRVGGTSKCTINHSRLNSSTAAGISRSGKYLELQEVMWRDVT